MINQPYASLDRLIELGYGANAEETCANLVGREDRIETNDVSFDDPEYRPKNQPLVKITAARVVHDTTCVHPYCVHVDAEEIQ